MFILWDSQGAITQTISAFLMLFVACKQDKIGYVDNVEIMEGYQEKKDIEAVYTKKSEAFNKKRDSISQAFQLQAQAFQLRAQKMAQQKD